MNYNELTAGLKARGKIEHFKAEDGISITQKTIPIVQ